MLGVNGTACFVVGTARTEETDSVLKLLVGRTETVCAVVCAGVGDLVEGWDRTGEGDAEVCRDDDCGIVVGLLAVVGLGVAAKLVGWKVVCAC